MSWIVCFWMSISMIIAGIILFAVKKEGRYLGAAVFVASVVMWFPVKMIEESGGFAFIMSVSQSIRMFVVDTGIGDITDQLSLEMLGSLFLPYKILACMLYLCAPMFTAGLVLKYFSNFFGYMKLKFKFRQDIYVFSELNERSIAIAESIWEQNRKVGIVFCKSDDKDDINKELEENIKQINAIYTMKTLDHMVFKNDKRKIAYFAVSQSDNDNLDDTLKLIDKEEIKEKNNIFIYCFSLAPEAEILLDSKDKGNLKVILFDEVRNAVYEQLFRHPLYHNIEKGNMINILIVGGGRIGTEFLKAAVWCGQMNSLGLKINLIDLKGDEICQKLKQECPELFEESKGYVINIKKGDVFRNDNLSDCLDGESVGEITYCVVALGDDDINIKTSIMLQRYFGMKNYSETPYICAKVGDTKKQKAVYEMYENGRGWNVERKEWDKKIYYNIHPFGDIRTMFGIQKSTSNLLDYLARGVHLSYMRPNLDNEEEVKQAIQGFYGKQGDRRSSIASGIHIKYKLWEMGYGILLTHDKNDVAEAVELKEKEKFYDLEHRRWMAYVRGEGWQFLTKDHADESSARERYETYYAKFKNKNPILKIHPALIATEEDSGKITLEEIQKIVCKVNKDNQDDAKSSYKYGYYAPDYVGSDRSIVDDMNWIVSGEWHRNPETNDNYKWIVKEFGLNDESAKICKLSELAIYFNDLYEKLDGNSTEAVLYLRECIKSCCYGVLRCGYYTDVEKEQCYKLLENTAVKEFMPKKAKEYKKLKDKKCLSNQHKEKIVGII